MKLICIGRNYAAHIEELKNEKPEDPVVFLKPDSAILLKQQPFVIPEFSNEVHHEVEILIKINKIGKYIAPEFAHKYYNEIGLGIDFTARDLQEICKAKGHPWEIAKSFEHSAPISKDFINKADLDWKNLQFSLKKNDEIVQVGNVKDMIFSIVQLIVRPSG